jgi:cysteine desulfurase / selenocysteine lyase
MAEMTTSNQNPVEAVSAGLAPLDASELERIANELFRGTPDEVPAARASSPVASWQPLAASPAPWQPSVSPSNPSPSNPLWVASAPVPRLGPSATVPASPGYYFLNEAEATRPAPVAEVTPEGGAARSWSVTELRPEVVPLFEPTTGPFDAASARRDFPILQERVHGRPLVWLDNAATTQKPESVIERIASFYRHENSNIHRAAHAMAARSTEAYEAARAKAQRFLNAPSVRDIVFVRGATEAINLVAQSWGRRNVSRDDEIVITWLEHHSNIVPWQMLAAETGAKLRVAPIDDRGEVILEEYERLLNPRTRLVALGHVSNALGTINPVREMAAMAHRHGARVLVDGAQAVSHFRVDVQALEPDFYVFSGHKVFGPTGIGVLYGRSELLDTTPPWQAGGNMIADVTFERTVYNPAPARFEAGTGNIADAVGLGAALDYVTRLGMENIERHERELLAYGTEALSCVPGLRPVGTAREKAGVLSFVLDGFRSEDVGVALDREGIAVRAGHHCAQPALRRFGLESVVRPSLALYNTRGDVDALVAALLRLQSGSTSLHS